MNKIQFLRLLTDPAMLKPVHNSQLKEIADQYPFYQSAQVIYYLSLAKSESVLANNQIKLAAAYAIDRKLLKNHSDKIKQQLYLTGPLESSSFYEISPTEVSIDEFDENATLKELQHDKSALTEPAAPQPITPQSLITTKTNEELIDQFIQNSPRISRSPDDFFDPDIAAKNSAIDKEDIVSETLAQIYYKQGKLDKAIKIYKKLSSAIPEKSSYFAVLIKKIKQEQNLNH